MKKQFKLGIIGCGNVATAVLRGVVLSDFIREKKIIVSDCDVKKLDAVNYLGVRTASDNRFVAENSEYLLLAVHAKDFAAVAESIEGVRPEKVISVVSGVSKATVKNSLGVGLIKVARCVPNAACAIGSGAIAIDMLDYNKSTDDTDFLSNVFGFLGTVVSTEESKLEAAAGVNCPISALMLIDALVDAGVKNGLTKNEAKILAVQTVLGVAEMVAREEESVSELLMRVCKGDFVALKAVKSLEDAGFRSGIIDAVGAATEKNEESE